jgi:hypothetical protein
MVKFKLYIEKLRRNRAMGIPQANRGPIVLSDTLEDDLILKCHVIINQMQKHSELQWKKLFK